MKKSNYSQLQLPSLQLSHSLLVIQAMITTAIISRSQKQKSRTAIPRQQVAACANSLI